MEKPEEAKIEQTDDQAPPQASSTEATQPSSAPPAGVEGDKPPISTPGKWDILCGRGKSTGHPGNQRFRRAIMARRDEYQQATRRDDKTRITCEIVDSLRSGPEPSRFLLKDPKTNLFWDVGDSYAREKISHALRSRPNQERRKTTKPRQRATRKHQISQDQEQMVQKLIGNQQRLLRELIAKEVRSSSSPVAVIHHHHQHHAQQQQLQQQPAPSSSWDHG